MNKICWLSIERQHFLLQVEEEGNKNGGRTLWSFCCSGQHSIAAAMVCNKLGCWQVYTNAGVMQICAWLIVWLMVLFFKRKQDTAKLD